MTIDSAKVTIDSGKCKFLFHAGPPSTVDIVGTECVIGKSPIQVTIPEFGCTVDIGAQNGLPVTFHNLNAATPAKTLADEGILAERDRITLSTGVINTLQGEETGAACPKPGAFSTGEFTTGNTILTGEDPTTGAMTKIWFTTVTAGPSTQIWFTTTVA